MGYDDERGYRDYGQAYGLSQPPTPAKPKSAEAILAEREATLRAREAWLRQAQGDVESARILVQDAQEAVKKERQERERAQLLASAPPDAVLDGAIVAGLKASPGCYVSMNVQKIGTSPADVVAYRRAWGAHIANWAREDERKKLLARGVRMRVTRDMQSAFLPTTHDCNATLIPDE